MENYLSIFIITAILSLALTFFFKWLAFKIGAVDQPNERKVHKHPIARLGGVAIFISFFSVILSTTPLNKHILGIFIGGIFLLVFGIADDIWGINPFIKLSGQALATLVIIASGIGIDFITNPFGGLIQLDMLKIPVNILGTTYHIVFWADLFTFFWILILINAINFLDGLDGLASGVSGISAIILFILSLSPDVSQPITALLAIALAGAVLGFLPLNFHPAKIFMGDSGSMFLGFLLAILAIFSGGKIATALLILGLPILDVAWAIIRRVSAGHSPFKPDKHHLHHELLKRGLSQQKVVLFMYSVTIICGLLALSAKAFNKLIALILLFAFTVFLISFLYFINREHSH